jgi:hypothetical protein
MKRDKLPQFLQKNLPQFLPQVFAFDTLGKKNAKKILCFSEDLKAGMTKVIVIELCSKNTNCLNRFFLGNKKCREIPTLVLCIGGRCDSLDSH